MYRFFEPKGGHDTGKQPAAPAQVALAVNGMGTFNWDVADGVMRYDDGGLAVMGFRPGEFDGRLATLGERMLPSELPTIEGLVDRALKERSGFSLYFRVRHRNGRLRWTHTQGHIVRDTQGRPVRVIGIIRDASQELRAVDQTEQLRQARDDRRRQADIVGHVSDALVPTVTVEDVAEALTTTRLMERVGASSIILGLIDNGRMELVGSNGVPEDLIRDFHLSRLSEPLPLTEAVRTREAVFVTSRTEFIERYPALAPYLTKFPEAAAAVYLPLIAHDIPIGAVGLTYEGRAHFPQDERTVLTALGKVIAQSLQRALLYDQEHELAAGLQTAMLPGNLPHVPGLLLATRYQPTRARGGIGGDWYDALTLPDGRFAAVVGDVQGHDVTAAAVMGQLRIALRAYAAEGHPPTTVMARASAFLAELDTDRFATCLLALLDPRTGAIAIVRAGHPEPVLRRPDGTCVWLDVPGGLPLGLTRSGAQPAYPVSETVLEPGSTLVMCTDGLIEARAEDLDQGRGRLLDALVTGPAPPEDLANHLLHTMAAYTGEEDDVALLVLKRSPGRPDPAPRMEATITPADPDALRAARRALRTALHDWSLDALSDTAELLACELATNALLHTAGNATLTATPVRNGGRGLRLAVTDTSPASPRRRAATEECTSGRGLVLIEELASTWGIEPRGSGKTVWCELSLDQL
ncbi:serine/threonine-protein phosphatase [Streptomyces sp. ISL-36]|uniref:SpoIIE family protein phosphatase n=1 Tax=Streptomyces sp. ISL-36 TaxID=2819182 RepID=UPI001BECE050|nr:SpoIIE family protein phosphatase [Streptomyces sp. ISL-36]MBT2441783.1 serine/threonine-protein phosphatase [Streptomyces sp. ISL-36]